MWKGTFNVKQSHWGQIEIRTIASEGKGQRVTATTNFISWLTRETFEFCRKYILREQGGGRGQIYFCLTQINSNNWILCASK